MTLAGEAVEATFGGLQYTVAVAVGIGMFAVVNLLGDSMVNVFKGRVL